MTIPYIPPKHHITMAIIKSQNMTQASGSVGGLTYTRTSSGMTIRARAMPVNPATDLQAAVRNIVKGLTRDWNSLLTQNERDAWTDYGKTWNGKNALGDKITISGLSAFVAINVPRLQSGLSEVVQAPTPSVTSDTAGGMLPALSIGQGTSTPWSVSANWSYQTFQPNAMVIIYQSTPQSPGTNFFKGPFRLVGAVVATAQEMALIENSTWQKGMKIFVRGILAGDDGTNTDLGIVSMTLANTPLI